MCGWWSNPISSPLMHEKVEIYVYTTKGANTHIKKMHMYTNRDTNTHLGLWQGGQSGKWVLRLQREWQAEPQAAGGCVMSSWVCVHHPAISSSMVPDCHHLSSSSCFYYYTSSLPNIHLDSQYSKSKPSHLLLTFSQTIQQPFQGGKCQNKTGENPSRQKKTWQSNLQSFLLNNNLTSTLCRASAKSWTLKDGTQRDIACGTGESLTYMWSISAS